MIDEFKETLPTIGELLLRIVELEKRVSELEKDKPGAKVVTSYAPPIVQTYIRKLTEQRGGK